MLVGCFITQLAKTHKGEALPTLLIPTEFSTTLGRPWLVNIFDLPVWVSLKMGRVLFLMPKRNYCV